MKFTPFDKAFAGILFALCIMGVVAGYAIPRDTSPPSKVWFEARAGDVIFPHTYHTSFVQCSVCHHDLEEGMKPDDIEMNCRACHYYGEAARDMESEDKTHPRFIGSGCTACHKDYEMDVSCETCHVRRGLAFQESGLNRPLVPESVEFKSKEGLVKFDHKLHLTEEVGEPCLSCHHEFKGGEALEPFREAKSCRVCHYGLADKIPQADDENHKRYIGVGCAECHGGDECSTCHKK